jgi:hypothetical protein
VGQSAEALEEEAVTLEIGAEHSRNGQDVVAVGHGSQHMVQDEAGGGLDVFLVAGRAEPAALAGEGEQELVLAMVAADASEAAGQVAAFQKLVNYLRDDGAEDAVAWLVLRGVSVLESIVVAVGTLPEG